MASGEKLTLREKLGQILLQRGTITKEQLREGLKVQQEEGKGKRIGEVLIELGYINKEELDIAFVIQCGRPHLRAINYRIDPEVINAVPEEIARKYNLIPLDRMGDILTVVMTDPLDKSSIEELENITTCKVRSFIGTDAEVKEAILHYYGSSGGRHEKESREQGEKYVDRRTGRF